MSRPYSRYRDSGVEWLGDVPEHWPLAQLGRLGSFFKGSGGTKEDEVEEGLPCVRYGDLYTQHQFLIEKTRANISEGSATKYTAIQYGDLLFAGSGETLEEIGKSAANLLTGPAYCGGDVILLRPSIEADATFLGYAADCSPAAYQKSCMGRGVTVMHIYSSELKYLLMPLPPLAEQRAIAAFLDRETGRIDALVAKKRLLIERLQEYRTALITRTVTRGLPPDAAHAAGLDPVPRLKPSGVEWLGDVPEHWEVKQLRRSVVLQRGHDLPNDERENGEVPVVSSAGVSDSHSVAAGNGPAIVTGRYGSIGEFHLVDGPFWPLNTTLYSINHCGNEVRFLRYLLMNLKHLFVVNAAKSAVPGVDRNDLHPIATVLPPHADQTAIADYLDSRLTRIYNTAGKAEALIARLQEYRTALITAAVTGKIDVRDAVRAPALRQAQGERGGPFDKLRANGERSW